MARSSSGTLPSQVPAPRAERRTVERLAVSRASLGRFWARRGPRCRPRSYRGPAQAKAIAEDNVSSPQWVVFRASAWRSRCGVFWALPHIARIQLFFELIQLFLNYPTFPRSSMMVVSKQLCGSFLVKYLRVLWYILRQACQSCKRVHAPKTIQYVPSVSRGSIFSIQCVRTLRLPSMPTCYMICVWTL